MVECRVGGEVGSSSGWSEMNCRTAALLDVEVESIVGVDHFNGAALFAVAPHRPLALDTGRAGDAKLRDLSAGTEYRYQAHTIR